MTDHHLPDGVVPGGTSPIFTEETLPDKLQAEHTLAPGHWAVLNVLEGSLRFVNHETNEDRLISAPDRVTIHPGLPHSVALEGRLRCRIDFFREPGTDFATESGKRGRRTVRSGVDAVTRVAGKVPGFVRKEGKDATGPRASPEYIIVEDLPDDLKECYLSVLVWLVHVDDGQIDDRELCEIQLLMTQVRGSAKVREAVRSHLEDPHGIEVEAQIVEMLTHVPSGNTDTADALRYCLIKDAIRVRRATSGGSVREQPGIRRLAGTLELDDEKVRFIENACQQDEKILAGELSDSQIANAAKGLAAQATAVGVPVAAVYLTGSVTGLSAAGIASGLAALGLGGVLGLSAMVSGIGVAVIVGGGVYKGVRRILGVSERNRASLRELMLQEVLRIHQRAIVNLGEDMSFFGERVAALASETERNRADLARLSREVTLLSLSANALTKLGERATGFDGDLQEEVARQAAR